MSSRNRPPSTELTGAHTTHSFWVGAGDPDSGLSVSHFIETSSQSPEHTSSLVSLQYVRQNISSVYSPDMRAG